MKKIFLSTILIVSLAAMTVVPVNAASGCTQKIHRRPLHSWSCEISTVYPDNTEKPAPEETPSEPEQTPSAPSESTASAIEQQVVTLVNAERAKYGLSALTLSEALCDGARLKSQDMATNGYFSHESPTYGTPFEMMRSLGISYRSAGENIAQGYATAEAVVNAWMNSEGHRANILSSSFTQIGVGYVANGNYWTQWFIS